MKYKITKETSEVDGVWYCIQPVYNRMERFFNLITGLDFMDKQWFKKLEDAKNHIDRCNNGYFETKEEVIESSYNTNKEKVE